MKITILAAVAAAILLCSCGAAGNAGPVSQPAAASTAPEASGTQSEARSEARSETEAEVDVDLTKMNGNMVYAKVNDMMVNPADYRGKTVRMNGRFAIYDGGEGKLYFACVISDATACCASGIEFVLAGEHSFPDDYPPDGSDITVSGVFGTYVEDNAMYCQLTGAVME